eukprot:COSAG01_NODE_33359_length_565_cov_1.311159_1_plen_28_part_01
MIGHQLGHGLWTYPTYPNSTGESKRLVV